MLCSGAGSSETIIYDSAIMPCEGGDILDDVCPSFALRPPSSKLSFSTQVLRERMVNTLPAGVSLTAIFDSCHSGTLLDLEHYDDECYAVPPSIESKNAQRKRAKRSLSFTRACPTLDPGFSS